MPTILTAADLKPYFQGKKTHTHYHETVKLYDGLRVHADGEYPHDLIEERRPFESIEVKHYRKKIWAAVTEETLSRVVTSLSKIRKSQDWSIKYTGAVPAKIPKGEDLETYCEKQFPYTYSVTNWLFSVCLKQYLIDANGIVALIPLNPQAAANEFLTPYPFIFNSSQVLDYVEGDYGIFYSNEKSTYKVNGAPDRTDGDVYYVITTEKIERWVQINVQKDIALNWEYEHGLPSSPMFKLGGIFFQHKDTIFLYKSRINNMVPYLNEAVREYSDLQAEVVQHIHSEKWEMAVEDCKQCQGLGKIQTGDGWGLCTGCKGRGKIDQSPYSKMLVRPANVGEQAIPVPPAGYLQKDVEIVKIQDARVESHKFNALSAINMQFLDQAPLNQSGAAKQVDRSELNNFVYSVAEDLVHIMDRVYSLVADYRYLLLIPGNNDRAKLLPAINVPERFDLLNVNVLIDEYLKAKNANINPVLRTELEKEIAVKRFSATPEVKNKLIAILDLDPLAGKTPDEKTSDLQNGLITKLDAVTSSYIVSFVSRALQQKGDLFYTLKFEEQQKLIDGYAREKLGEMEGEKGVAG